MNGNWQQQSEDDTEDSFQQTTDTEGDRLEQQTAEYHANQDNRQRHAPEWWGTRHPYPENGDPDREFIYARNLPISGEEVDDAVTAYNRVATNRGTEEFNTLGVSMRPTTPPMERARKEVEGLVEQGIEVTTELRDEIYERLTRDSGLIAALQEYCRNGDDVPNAHANELLKMLDRLKALLAEEMVKSSKQIQELSDNFDDYKKSKEERMEMLEEKLSESETKLAEAKDKLESKQSELDKIKQQDGVDSIQQINGVPQSDDKVARLLKEKALLQSKIVMYEAGKTREEVESAAGDEFRVDDEYTADLIAAEDRANTADRERQAGNHFHQEFYEAMKEKAELWEAKATTAENPNQYGAMSSDAVRLLHEVAGDLGEMVQGFQRGWPPAHDAFDVGQIQQDNVTKDALERSRKELREKHEENKRRLQDLELQETEIKQKLEGNAKLIKENDQKTKELETSQERLQRVTTTGSPAPSPPGELVKLKKYLSQHKAWLAQKDDENNDLSSENDELKDQVDKLAGEKEKLEKEHEEKKKEVRKLGNDITNLMNSNTELRGQRNALEADIKKVRNKKEALEKEKKQLESEQATNQTEMKKLQDEKDKLEKLRQDESKKLKECMAARQKKGGLDIDAKKLDDLRKEKEKLEAQLATDQNDLEKARADNRGLTKERDDLQQSLEKKVQETKGLEQEKKQMHVDCKEEKRRLEENIQSLQERHNDNEREVEELRHQGDSKWHSADALIRAAARAARNSGSPDDDDDETPTLEGAEMSLMDRINYLNLSVFLRTRNYVELALREGCNRLANMLIHDANKWAEQCRDDLSKMNPSVNNQVRASIYVLNGLKRVMVAKDMNEINKGAREFKYGQKILVSQNADPATFGQLIDLAGSLVDWLDRLNISHDHPELRRGLQVDKVSWKKNIEFVITRRAKLQSGLRNDSNLKANVLRRTGLHSPLTPERWGDDVVLGDDEVMSRRRSSEDGN